MRPGKGKKTKKELEQLAGEIVELREEGLTQKEITDHLNTGITTVSKVLQQRGIKRLKAGVPDGPKEVTPYDCKCGYKVKLRPCQICIARRAVAIRQRKSK